MCFTSHLEISTLAYLEELRMHWIVHSSVYGLDSDPISSQSILSYLISQSRAFSPPPFPPTFAPQIPIPQPISSQCHIFTLTLRKKVKHLILVPTTFRQTNPAVIYLPRTGHLQVHTLLTRGRDLGWWRVRKAACSDHARAPRDWSPLAFLSMTCASHRIALLLFIFLVHIGIFAFKDSMRGVSSGFWG